MAETATLDSVIEKGLAYLRERLRIEAAYLFGSQLTGDTHEDSDIDLAVFSPDVDKMDFFQRIRVQSDLALDCDSRLELHLYPSRALAEARPTNFAGYIVTHGKRLI
ncbi:MAG: nucleotidyltransferase domain-containing protein [Terriglobia bacterium]